MSETEDAPRYSPNHQGMDEIDPKDVSPAQCPAEPAQSIKPSPPPSDKTDDVDLTTQVFRFLSTATPGTLGAVAAGLVAVTYLIIGQIGLLLIGAFGGIVFFIQWEQRHVSVARAVRGERGFDVLERLLELKSSSTGSSKDGADSDDEEQQLLRRFDDFQPETREALTELVEAVIKDYVKWWYDPIVPSDRSFPLACRNTLSSFLLAISNHLGKKRPADGFLNFLTNSSSIIIVFFSELSNAFAEVPSESHLPAADVIYTYLAENPDSNLSNLLNQRQQAAKFRMVSEDLLGFLDRPTRDCDPAKTFLREILAGVCLEMTLQTCSKAEWINGWIVYLLEAGEPDFNQAIDVGMQTRPSADNTLIDIDGNLGNIGLVKGNRNSFDTEKARRKESMTHKKKLSKADEEMEMAMEEMKRMNQMIAEAEAQRTKQAEAAPPKLPDRPAAPRSANEASERLADALKRNANELDMQPNLIDKSLEIGNGLEPSEAEEKQSTSPSSSDGQSPKEDIVHSPITPRSNAELSSQNTSPTTESHSQFINFDQIMPPAQDESEAQVEPRKQPPPMTLHNATITVLDEPGDKGRIKNKPTWDYLVQIEPANTAYPGWMIVRKYTDFESLHEILRRIAMISGATAFTEQHNTLPLWKVHTRSSLRGDLERYLRDACWYPSLADSEGLKRFLEKDHGHTHSSSKSGFQAFEKLGKNVFDVLTSAHMEGSKVVVGGVTGVLGNMGIGQRKPSVTSLPTSSSLQDVTAASRLSMSTPPRMDSTGAVSGRKARDSLDSQRSSVIATQPGKIAPMERRPSYNSQGDAESESLRPSQSDRWERPSSSVRNSREHSRASSMAPHRSPSTTSLDGLKLPPPPDAMPDDFESPTSPVNGRNGLHGPSPSLSRSLTSPVQGRRETISGSKAVKQVLPMSEQETRVAVELLFAVINELYTLSSAWNIRRTLLAAAKSFLLRPGNPSLASIQSLIQTSVIEANTSDSGIAAHLKKLRENTMPTEEERAAWPEELTAEEKEKLRIKARKLLIESGVPAALMGVMGQSATSDALGRIFDCIQVEEVARGLMFGLMLQAVRTITH